MDQLKRQFSNKSTFDYIWRCSARNPARLVIMALRHDSVDDGTQDMAMSQHQSATATAVTRNSPLHCGRIRSGVQKFQIEILFAATIALHLST